MGFMVAREGNALAVAGVKRAPDFLELDPGFAPGLPKARAATYRKIEGFFNLRLYDYGVRIGPAKEVK